MVLVASYDWVLSCLFFVWVPSPHPNSPGTAVHLPKKEKKKEK